MLWQSISLITVIDILILGIVGYAAAGFLRGQGRRPWRSSEIGSFAILGGLLLVALFYLADLLVMHAVPSFMPRAEAMAFMRELHLNGSWLVVLLGIGTICLGFTSVNRRAVTLMNDLSQELTERKRAEEALHESEERFRAVVDNSPTKIHIKDADGRYVLVNRLAERMFGVTDEGARGKTTHEIFPQKQADAFVAHDQAVLQSGETIEQEEEWFKEDGVHTFLTVKFPIRDGSGQVVSVGAIGTDITERKQAVEQLHQAQKMEAVGQLTSGVAHDFNNMLAVILGNAEMLEDELGADNPQLTAVFSATKRAADLTQRLLAFSRKQVLNPEIININSLIADTTGLLHRTLEEHIDIETVAAAGLWTCEVDPAQLENALVNLALNARDAMPDGGKLTIETCGSSKPDPANP